MIDSRLKRVSQSVPGTRLRVPCAQGAMPLLAAAPLLFQPVVGKDYEELIAVIVTLAISFGLMVAFGAWWSR